MFSSQQYEKKVDFLQRTGQDELAPGPGNEFTLKQAKIVSIRFKTDEKGSVSAMELIQPDGIYEAKRVEE